jgi:hypothetical protein
MADLGEAFDIYKTNEKSFQNIEYFFTQRNLNDEQEVLDKNMNRIIKKIKVIHNFLAINIPSIISNGNNCKIYDKPIGFDVEIFGDDGYHYKGTITSFHGIIPNLMIPIKKDKKLFIHIDYNIIDNSNNNITKKFINFIDVPKRYQINNDINEKKDLINSSNNSEIDFDN